jgi:hypothetical protein
MTIATIKAKALLVEIANSLSTEATAAGKASLATALTELGSEISSQTVSESEFFINADSSSISGASGAGQIWADILSSAANVVHGKQLNTVNGYVNAIKTSQDTIAISTTGILAQETIIADKQTAIETYQKKLKELGEGSGIRILSPNEIFGFVKLYQLLIEQGKILDEGDKVSEAQQANARAKIKDLATKVQSLIGEFSAF